MILKNLYEDCLNHIASVGLHADWSRIRSVSFANIGDARFGQLNMLPNNNYDILISSFLNHDELADILRITLYHELCHFLQMQELITKGYIEFDEKGAMYAKSMYRSYIDENLLKNSGHTTLWQMFADVLNNKLSLNITATAQDDLCIRVLHANGLDEDFFVCKKDLLERNISAVDDDVSVASSRYYIPLKAFVDFFGDPLPRENLQQPLEEKYFIPIKFL